MTICTVSGRGIMTIVSIIVTHTEHNQPLVLLSIILCSVYKCEDALNRLSRKQVSATN